MSLFGPNKEEQKRQQHQQKIKSIKNRLEANLNLQLGHDDANIMDYIAEDVNKVDILTGASSLANLATNNPVENLKLAYLATLVDQNWLIIKKLSEISSSMSNNSDSTSTSGTGVKNHNSVPTPPINRYPTARNRK